MADGCNFLTPLHQKLFKKDMPFRGCCEEHDLFYEQGGKRADRAFADKLFRKCIKAKGYKVSAWVCWVFVRAFGGFFWGTPK